MKIYKQLIFIILLIVSMSVSAFASGSVNVILSNQNPDPVSPGNFVFLNIKVSNPGANEVRDVRIEFVGNDNFRLAQGQERNRNIGPIPAFSTNIDSSSYVIVRYKLEVNERTPLGLNTVRFNAHVGGSTFEYNFNVLVQDANPTIQIEDFSVNEIAPGASEEISITMRNSNSVTLKDIIITLDLENVENRVFTTRGSNQFIVGTLSPGERKEFKFNIQVDPQAQARPYILPIDISYRDTLDNPFSQRILGSVRVFSEPELTISLDSQSSKSIGRSRVSYAIANPGTSSIRGVRISVLNSEDYTILDGSFHYIGDLNPDDFQTAQSELFIRSSDNPNLLLLVQYSDSYNRNIEEIIEIPLRIYTQAELRELGLTSGNSGILNLLLILALLGGVFFIGRKIGMKKKNKKE